MENKIILANIFEELKIEEEENDKLTREIEEMKRAKERAHVRYLEEVEYVRSLQLNIEQLKSALRIEQRAYQMEHRWRKSLEQQIEQIKAVLGGA